MKQFKLFAIAVAAIAFSSCSSYSYTSLSTVVEREAINGTAMVVDVRPDFSKRIATESSRCKTPSEAREEAKYIAITTNKCDVVVDAIYKVEKRSGKYKAYLTGFAGFYENPRTVYEDINLMKNISREDLEKYLILKDPQILELINQKGNSEVINIFEGGKPDPKDCPKAAPAPAPAPAPKAAPAPAPAPAPKAAPVKTGFRKRK
jgi:hypothetical protein